MKTQKVRKKDLIGDIKDFPIEIVQAMVDEQVMQGSKADVEVFQECAYARCVRGGFDWSDSVMGEDFWDDVLYRKRFDTFFQKYQKNEK